MAETSAIEWTDSTFNPWIGCTKISPACDHCYAEALMDKRHGRVTWGGERSRTGASNWHQPRRWQKQATTFLAGHGRRQRVFCSSLADVFDNQVPDEWRDDLWALIRDTPALDWQLLTKRPQNIAKMLPSFWGQVKGHVWLGTTVEDQTRADINIPHLLLHDAAVRFISVEPMLGPIDLNSALGGTLWIGGQRGCGGTHHGIGTAECPKHLHHHHDDRCRPGLDWVIAGGESGPKARPSHPAWFRSLRDQCAAAGVPFLFKQWGSWAPSSPERARGNPRSGWRCLAGHPHIPRAEELCPEAGAAFIECMGKKSAGRLLDGIEHNGFPEANHG